MLIPYSGLPATPPQPVANNPDLQAAQHTDHLICTIIFLGQYRPVPLLSGSLPPFLHDIMRRTGHTPLSLHYFRGATRLANPYLGALFLQSHYLMGPCCGKHLSSLLWAISSEPYSLLHFTMGILSGALFLRHLYTRHTHYIMGFSTSLH
jgi:hypothetical protein